MFENVRVGASAQEAAVRTIEEAQIIRLSVEDQRAFAEAILNPPPPSSGLLRAAGAYRTLIRAGCVQVESRFPWISLF